MGDVLKERTERAQGGEELLSVTIANGVLDKLIPRREILLPKTRVTIKL